MANSWTQVVTREILLFDDDKIGVITSQRQGIADEVANEVLLLLEPRGLLVGGSCYLLVDNVWRWPTGCRMDSW